MESESKDLSRKVVFVVEDMEQLGDAEKISSKSPYFSQLVAQFTPDQEIRIILPKWATMAAFRCLLDHTEDIPMGELDIKTYQRVLWLSDFFKMATLQELCISKIIPLLSKDNVLVFLEDSFAKISSAALAAGNGSDINDAWINLYQECLSVAAVSIPFLVKAAGAALYKMESMIVEELADKAFKKFIVNVNSDNGAIIEMLLKYRQMENPFELLDFETNRLCEREKTAFAAETATPTLTWNLTGLKGHFYKDSGPFPVLGSLWELSIWCSQQDGTVSIAIKQGKQPKDELNASMKMGGTGAIGGIVAPAAAAEPAGRPKNLTGNTVKVSPRDKELTGKKSAALQEDEGDGNLPAHCIVTLASLVRLAECEEKGEGAFQIASLISGSKSRTVLRVVQPEELLASNGKLTVEVTLKLEYTYSGILTYISRNFNWLYHDPQIARLTKNQFMILLKHKFLNAKTEEDTLTALCIWLEQNKSMANNITEILENINWGYISLSSLLDVVRTMPLIRTNPAFKKIFTEEMTRRFENKEVPVPPRVGYKYTKKEEEKMSFSENIVSAMLDPRDAISKVVMSSTKPEAKADEGK